VASTEAKVAHVWRRLGFGPGPDDVAAGVAAGGARAAIDDLLSRPAPATNWQWPGGTVNDAAWNDATRVIELMSTSYPQVRERIAWILQGILVIAWGEVIGAAEMENHLNTLRSWPARTYKDLLSSVVRSFGMQWYLSGIGSAPPHPNQNLACELMELFSLGVTDPRTGAANYTQTDVQEIARALTGFQVDWSTRTMTWQASSWDSGAKTFLGSARGAAGVTEVINAIAGHASFRHFIPHRLYVELVGLEPTASTLDQLASTWGSTGNIAAVVAAIARRPEFVSDAAIRARVKSPVELVVSTMRVLGVREFSHLMVWWVLLNLRQHPFMPPNVSGWPSGKAWLHAGTLVNWSGPAQWITFSDSGAADVPANLQLPTVRRLFSQGSSATGGDLALKLAGLYDVSSQTLSAVRAYAASGTWNFPRAAATMSLVLQSPEFYVN